MKKIYAREVDCEFFDYEAYYSTDEAESDLFCAYGNERDFRNLNNYRADYVKKLENCKYDIDTIRNEIDDESTAEELDANKEEILDTVRYYFRPQEDRADFTDLELDDLKNLCDEFYSCCSNKEDDIICRALEICYGFKFKTGYIHGCSQGDWMKYMCPETLSQEAIDYIESVLFATGTEYCITENECESLEEAEAAFDKGDCFHAYTAKWCAEDIKEDLASQCYSGCKAEDIVLLTIKKRHVHYSYDYEEQ